jgi:hypothetical protein
LKEKHVRNVAVWPGFSIEGGGWVRVETEMRRNLPELHSCLASENKGADGCG